MSESSARPITTEDVQRELLLSLMNNIIDNASDMRFVGSLLCGAISLAYVNVTPEDRVVWLAALAAFVEGLPEIVALDETQRSQPTH